MTGSEIRHLSESEIDLISGACRTIDPADLAKAQGPFELADPPSTTPPSNSACAITGILTLGT